MTEANTLVTSEPVPPPQSQSVVLTIDIGGSHVKILTNTPSEKPLRVDSGPTMTAEGMIDAVKTLAKDIHYDVISIGYPGAVRANRVLLEPHASGHRLDGP